MYSSPVTRQNNKSIFAALIGNILEYYDVMLYGFFAPLLAKIFFPETDPHIAIMASLGAFAAGFISRPIGAVFFGHIGDRFGRRKSLLIAILLVTIPTLVIGLLPSYTKIGIMAPLVLIFCRLLQGLCVGGEWSGAAVFVMEHTTHKKRGFVSGLMCSTGYIGALIGTAISALFTLSIFPEWGWRIPFLLGAVWGFLGYLARKRVSETPAFETIQCKEKIQKIPLYTVIKQHRHNFLCVIGLGFLGILPFYLTSVHMGVLLSTKLNLASSSTMFINVYVMLLWVLLIPTGGYLADYVGIKKVMLYTSAGLAICAYPLFYLLQNDLSVQNILMTQFIFSVFGAFYISTIALMTTKMFPTQARYSGIAVGLTIGQAMGGSAPFLSSFLVNWTGDEKAPAYLLMTSAVLGFVAVLKADISGSKTLAKIVDFRPSVDPVEESLKMSSAV